MGEALKHELDGSVIGVLNHFEMRCTEHHFAITTINQRVEKHQF